MIETDENCEVYSLLTSIKSEDKSISLYEHLEKLYETKMIMNDDEKFMDLFEEISEKIKLTGKYYDEEKKRETLQRYLEEFLKNKKQKESLLKPLIKINEGEEEPEVITQVTFVPEYHDIFQALEWCGVTLGEKESFLLTNSLRNLCSEKNLPNGAVFWGKVYGRDRDYYIAEASGIEPASEQEQPQEMEKRNDDGVNRSTYFVATDLTTGWTELPDVTPAQIMASRRIRYILSGDLNKIIVTNPHFPGKEKDYLRCQVARITHGTSLEPSNGHWKVADPETPFKQLEKDEEKKPMEFKEYLDMNNWIHFLPGILKQGRVSHNIEVPEDVPDEEEFRKKEMEKDPFDKRGRPIPEDANLPSAIPNVKIPAWKLGYTYDDRVYTNHEIKLDPENPDEIKTDTANYLMIYIRSLRWPGSYTVWFKGETYRFYFGWGHKFVETTMGENFVYQEMEPIMNDVDDYVDHPEPNSPPHEEEAENQEDEKRENAEDEEDDA